MKIKSFLLAVMFISSIFYAQSHAQIASDNINSGVNVAKSFSDNSFRPAEVYVYIPDSAATYYNLQTAVGYEINFSQNSLLLPYVEVEKNTYHKSKRDNFKLGLLFNLTVSDTAQNFILDNFIDVRYKRDFLPNTFNSVAASYYLNPYFPSIKNDFVKAILPTGKRLTLIDSLLKYKNNFSVGYDYSKKLDDPKSDFSQSSLILVKLDWSLYFLKQKRDLVDLNVSYHLNTKFSYDSKNKKYYNLFKAYATYYFLNDGKNSLGLRYEFVRGDSGVDDIQFDSYQKIMFTFKFNF